MSDNIVGSPRIEEKLSLVFEPKPKNDNKTLTKKKLKDQIFVETIWGINNDGFGLGYLPLNEQWIKFLVLGGYENRREVKDDHNLFNQEVVAQAYRIEPQLQFNLFENSENFLAKSQLYLRTQYNIIDNTGNAHTKHNLITEVVQKFPGENVVLRGDLIVNNLADPERETLLVFAPFIKTPAVSAFIFRDLRFRFAPEYSRNFFNDQDDLLFHAKVEGTVRENPWWGWSIQSFWPVDIEGVEDQPLFDFSGIYLWTGSVLPSSWLGEGYFLEGGIFLGKDTLLHSGNYFFKDMTLGLGIKFKFGTECRWWQ